MTYTSIINGARGIQYFILGALLTDYNEVGHHVRFGCHAIWAAHAHRTVGFEREGVAGRVCTFSPTTRSGPSAGAWRSSLQTSRRRCSRPTPASPSACSTRRATWRRRPTMKRYAHNRVLRCWHARPDLASSGPPWPLRGLGSRRGHGDCSQHRRQPGSPDAGAGRSHARWPRGDGAL